MDSVFAGAADAFSPLVASLNAFTLPCVVANAALVIAFIAGFVFRPLGKADKAPLFAFLLSAYFFLFSKTLTLVAYKKADIALLAAEGYNAAATFFILGAMKIQTLSLASPKKRREDGETDRSDITENLFSSAIKRIEVVPTEKFSFRKETDFRLNPSEIKNYIGKLREKDLSADEEDELDKTEMDLEKYSYRAASPLERKVFSERLEKLLKMISKYG